MTNRWPETVETDALRFFVAGKDLPTDDPADGVARVCELKVILDNGTVVAITDFEMSRLQQAKLWFSKIITGIDFWV